MVQERLARIPNHGIGYGILKYLTPPGMKQELTFRPRPQISFNYLGEYGFNPGELSLQASSDMAPFRVSDRAPVLYDLTFNAIVEGGKMQIFLAYDPRQFEEETIRSLLNEMGSLLRLNRE